MNPAEGRYRPPPHTLLAPPLRQASRPCRPYRCTLCRRPCCVPGASSFARRKSKAGNFCSGLASSRYVNFDSRSRPGSGDTKAYRVGQGLFPSNPPISRGGRCVFSPVRLCISSQFPFCCFYSYISPASFIAQQGRCVAATSGLDDFNRRDCCAPSPSSAFFTRTSPRALLCCPLNGSVVQLLLGMASNDALFHR